MTQEANGAIVKSDPTLVEFVPFGAEDKIKLSVSIIRNLIASPTREGDLPDDRECMRFMMLCRAGRLNPFAGDAYLLGFKDTHSGAVKWSLITAIHALYKRAETHPEYDGIESGVIVKDSAGGMIDRVGDFTQEGDTLVGGWATVHFRNRKHPTARRVKLTTYQKAFGVWKFDPAGMICKVAEAHALRDSFPTLMGGLYLKEEIESVESTTAQANGKLAALNAAVKSPVPHPTEPTQVIDPSTSNEPIQGEELDAPQVDEANPA